MAFDSQLLDGMVVFVEVINGGSFTQAALTSGHSTSYISKEINKLEARLGVRLMQRTTRSLSLTPEGEVYFQQCQQIIDDAEQAQNRLSGGQAQPKGTLRISCPTNFGITRMRTIFSEFIKLYPEVDLEVDLKNNDQWSLTNPEGKIETIKLNSRVQTNSSELEVSLCVAGHGVMLMPRFNLNGELERGEINVYVVYPSRKHMSAKVCSFIDFVCAELA